MLWILLVWQFTAAEFLGGLVLIVLMSLLLRLFVSRQLEESGRTYYFCGPGCLDRFAVRARGLEPPRAARPSGT